MESNQCFFWIKYYDFSLEKSVLWFILDLFFPNTVNEGQVFRVELLLMFIPKSQGKPAKPGYFTHVLEAQWVCFQVCCALKAEIASTCRWEGGRVTKLQGSAKTQLWKLPQLSCSSKKSPWLPLCPQQSPALCWTKCPRSYFDPGNAISAQCLGFSAEQA